MERLPGGAGNLGHFFRIRVYVKGEAYAISDLAGFVREFRDAQDFYAQGYGDADVIKRAIPFADTGGGDLSVWDPTCSEPGSEAGYAVFLLAHGDEEIVPMSPNFEAFVFQGILGQDYAKALQQADPRKVEMLFQEFSTQTPGM